MSSQPPVHGPVLPSSDKRNVLITAALPYVNNVPHLGNIVGSTLSGDVYARFCRMRGYNTLYVCGTDEYGTATETKAQQEGVTPKELCDRFHVLHKGVYEWFGISFDHFGRTTTPKQTEIAQDIFKHCDANGYVCSESVQQLYCLQCTRFLADRFVAGTCPLCGYDDAKGDQCDKCSQLINAVELIKPRCTVCSATPEVRSSEHLFLDLPKLESKLIDYVKATEENWSDNGRSVTESWIKGGLRPRAITRDLKWGTPVPKPGFEDKVFYVWFDAPIGYISITANYTDEWQQWWKPDPAHNVSLVQFIGKDNIPFHTVIFPSTLIAAEDKYVKLQSLSSTEYLNYEGAKFSKTRGIGVFGDQARDTGVPVEVWRYYLLANRPEASDTMFSWDDFGSKTNNELNNNLGNLVQRALAFIKSKFEGVIPPVVGSHIGEAEQALESEVSALLIEYVAHLDKQEIRDALRVAMSISMAGNKYMQEKKPWAQAKEDITACGTSLTVIVQIIYLLAIVMEPFMPTITEKILSQLATTIPACPLASIPSTAAAEATPETAAAPAAWPLMAALAAFAEGPEAGAAIRATGALCVPSGHVIGEPAPVFTKIDGAKLAALRTKFQGAVTAAEEGTPFPLTLVTGVVTKAEPHPTNSKCLVLSVDCGKPDPAQIVSRLADDYTTESIVGQTVVVLSNIKHGRFGGVLSQGMLITGSYVKDGNVVARVVTSTAPKGTTVLPEGFSYKPAKTFDVKAKLPSLQLNIGADEKSFAGTSILKAGDHFVTVEGAPEGTRLG